MKRRFAAFFIILSMLIIPLSGCSSDPGESGEKVFRFAVTSEPTTYDPTLCNSIVDNEVQHAISEGLTRTSGNNVSPGIAESWDISEDGRVYTFHLRDAKWSDGVPITAGDFVYSWRRLANPAFGSEYGFATWMIEGGKEVNIENADPETLGVRAIDDRTLEVRLVNPTSYFLSYIGSQANFMPIRKDIAEQQGAEFAKDVKTNVYSGPFILTDVQDGVWTFTKNPEFWDAENIRLDSAEMHFIEDEALQVSMFEEDELDFARIPNDKVPAYRENEKANHYLNGNMDFCYINPYSDNAVLGNLDFRQALNYALNRKECNRAANSSMFKPYGALIFPGVAGKDGVIYGEAYDVDSYAYPIEGEVDIARHYLQTGMEELGIRNEGDINVELLIMDTPLYTAVADELQRQWTSELGINVTVRTVSRSKLYDKYLPAAKYQIALAGWGPDYNDPYTYLEIFGSDNTSYTPYSNPEFDALLEESVTERDPAKRMDILNKAEQMLISDAAFIPVHARDVHYLLDPAVSDLVLSFSNITLDWAYVDIVDNQ